MSTLDGGGSVEVEITTIDAASGAEARFRVLSTPDVFETPSSSPRSAPIQEMPDRRQAVRSSDGVEILDVIGSDDRRPVIWPEMHEGVPYNFYPHQTMGRVIGQFPDGKTRIGSGVMIGRRHLLTAGHCVNLKGIGPVISNTLTYRPIEDNGVVPIGTTTIKNILLQDWGKTYDKTDDYSILILDYEFGDEIGWLACRKAGDGYFKNLAVNVSGYPGDKGGKTMYTAQGKITGLTDKTLEYDVDTNGGQSGAPVWHKSDGKHYVLGTHVQGFPDRNIGVRVHAKMFEFIKAALVTYK